MTNINKTRFVDRFRGLENFYDVIEYENAFGFSIKRNSINNAVDQFVSMLSFYIPEKDLNDDSKKRKQIYASAVYGKASEDGVTLRDLSKLKISEPADISNKSDISYDVIENKFYYKSKEIEPNQLVSEFYSCHIKTTKKFSGLWVRMKLYFFKIFLVGLFNFTSSIFYYLLYYLTGDKYSFEPFFQTESLNDKIISEANKTLPKPVEEKAESFDFFGYKASRRAIIIYSFGHILAYSYFLYLTYIPGFVVVIVKYNFFTLIYVVSSLWLIERLFPKLFRTSIRKFSKLSSRFQTCKIKI